MFFFVHSSVGGPLPGSMFVFGLQDTIKAKEEKRVLEREAYLKEREEYEKEREKKRSG